MTTGQRIKAARKAAKMTQADLASKLGVPYQSISQWERDLRNPKYDTLSRIADALSVPPAYLQGWDDAIASLEAAGKSVEDIAYEMGISVERIIEIVTSQGIHSAEAASKIIRVASLLAKESRQSASNLTPDSNGSDIADASGKGIHHSESDFFEVGSSFFGGKIRVAEVHNLDDEHFAVTFQLENEGMTAAELLQLLGSLQKISAQVGVSVSGIAQLAEAAANAIASMAEPSDPSDTP